MKLAGAIRDETGAPANDCKLTVTIKTQFASTTLPVLVKNNLFQVRVPVGQSHWSNLELSAASADGRRTGRMGISNFQLREAAIGGLELTVKPPERYLEVTVIDKGSPVRDAFVIADAGRSPAVHAAKTNDVQGVVRFPLMTVSAIMLAGRPRSPPHADQRLSARRLYCNRKPPRDLSGKSSSR